MTGIAGLVIDGIRETAKPTASYPYCKVVRDCIPSDAETISLDDLRRLVHTASDRGLSQTPVAVTLKVALREGRLEDGEFARWAKGQESGIAKMNRLGNALKRILESDSWRRSLVYSYKSPRPERPGEMSTFLELDFDDPAGLAFLRQFLDSIPHEILRVGEKELIGHLAESLGFVPTSAMAFGAESFTSQLSWCDGLDGAKIRRDAKRMARRLHLYAASLCAPDEGGFGYGTGLTKAALDHDRICTLWQAGYRAVLYNPMDPIPEPAKWLLFPNRDECLSASFKPNRPYPLDLTASDERLQGLVKRWIWRGDLSSAAVRRAPEFAIALSERIAARGMRIISHGEERFLVKAETLASYLEEATSGHSAPSSRRHIKGWLRSFLEFGEGVGVLQVEPTCYMHLATTAAERGDEGSGVGAMSLEDLRLLSTELEERSAGSLVDELVYAAFCVQALTPLRISEILTMRVNGLDRSPRKGLRAVRVARKASHRAAATVQVPETAYRMLDAVRTATEDARKHADPSAAEYLFVYPASMGVISLLEDRLYRSKLREAALAVGVEKCSPRNLRKRYMTEVVEKGVAKNLSRLALRPLTGHSSDAVTNRHYLREDIRAYLEAVHGIEIGTPRIPGSIEADSWKAAQAEDVVEGGAGVCRNPECNVAGTVTCLMCSGFLTTPRFIPAMREAVATLDERIARSTPHDREHLLSVKRLYLAYLGRMMEIDDEERGGHA